MSATLPSFWRPKRVVGASATLVMIVLLAFAGFRPAQPAAAPEPDIIRFATIEPEIRPNILPVAPLQKIDLPPPMVMVNLPDFENPMESPVLPSLSPVTSESALPGPSGNEALFGKPDGTGRTNGAGSVLRPPVRRITEDAPFAVTANKAGLVTSLDFCVTDKGRVRDVQLAVPSGFDDLDTTAARWLERQRFRPGTLDGVPARMCATYDVRWINAKASPAEARAAASAHASAIQERSSYPRQFVYWPQDRPFPGCDAVDICETGDQ